MPGVGLLIVLSIGGAWMCCKARAAGPALAFGVLSAVLIVSTPVGSGLPGAVSVVFSVVDRAATPALMDEPYEEDEDQRRRSGSTDQREAGVDR